MITENNVLRTISKLCLNSLYGKYAQRNILDKTTYIDHVEDYLNMMTDDSKIIKDMNEECVALKWCEKEDFAELSSNTNVVIAAYTTAQARLHLYEELEKLNERVLYFDTDSIIYVRDPHGYNPAITSHLGGLKSELSPGEHIEVFVSAGPKNYAYKTNKNEVVCKIRGFTLNTRNSLLLNLETMKDIVTKNPTSIVTINDPHKIVRKKGKIYSLPQEKKYRLVYDKRVIGENYVTYPYGYKR